MIHIPRWKAVLIILACVLGILYSLPNALSPDNQTLLKNRLPGWMPTQTVNLGLDLRGGAHLLYEVDLNTVYKERADLLVQDARSELREKKIGYSRIGAVEKGLRVVLRDAAQKQEALSTLRGINPNLTFTDGADALTIEAALNEAEIKMVADQTLSQSIEIVRRRVDEIGTTEPVIVRQGENRILLQVPGANAEDLKRIVGTTAKLTFHLVAEPGNTSPGGTRTLPMTDEPGQSLAIDRKAMITGEMLDSAAPGFGQSGEAIVTFRMNSAGARRFCTVSTEQVGKPFAIVLDEKIISAPVIREPICGGSGQISGSFTVQSANDLALLLRAGALPAPLNVVEERTVGPSLGADSIASGAKACFMALVFVAIFCTLSYGLFGIFATIGIVMNVTILMAIMSVLQATLTLPGIAGIVLTIGLAVDGNVLVFERIKEELRDGRSILSAIDAGYTRARTTITDSNATSLIAALILFSFGTGPIKGFAVTMCIGVATSYFCALMLTRLMVLTWYNWAKPKAIAA